MRQYEVVCLVKVETDNALIQTIDKVLTEGNGEIKLSENWNRIELSYPIKKEKEANFLVRVVQTAPQNIVNFKKLPRLKKDILRVLVINTEKEKSYVPNTALSKTKITWEDFLYQITRGHRKIRVKPQSQSWVEKSEVTINNND